MSKHGYAIARASPCALFMEQLQGARGASRGGSAPTAACSAVASAVLLGTTWLHWSSPAPLDLLRDGTCCLLASFELNFEE